MYVIKMTCWEFNRPNPYNVTVEQQFETEAAAMTEIERMVQKELATLNEGREKVPVQDSDGDVVCYDYPFRGDFDGEHAAIVRLWDGDDYRNVTAYAIVKAS